LKKSFPILIVDDNRSFVDRIIILLEGLHTQLKIRVASDYYEAVHKLTFTKPKLILLDINLPGRSGIDFLKYVKEKDVEVKVIMISNHSGEQYREQCLELGASCFLDKSNDFSRVPELVEFYLASQQHE